MDFYRQLLVDISEQSIQENVDCRSVLNLLAIIRDKLAP